MFFLFLEIIQFSSILETYQNRHRVHIVQQLSGFLIMYMKLNENPLVLISMTKRKEWIDLMIIYTKPIVSHVICIQSICITSPPYSSITHIDWLHHRHHLSDTESKSFGISRMTDILERIECVFVFITWTSSAFWHRCCRCALRPLAWKRCFNWNLLFRRPRSPFGICPLYLKKRVKRHEHRLVYHLGCVRMHMQIRKVDSFVLLLFHIIQKIKVDFLLFSKFQRLTFKSHSILYWH